MSRSTIFRCGIALGAAVPLASADVYWHGVAHAPNWGNPLAWDQMAVPGESDTARLSANITLGAMSNDTAVIRRLVLDDTQSTPVIDLIGKTLQVMDGGTWKWGGFSNNDTEPGTVDLYGTMTLAGTDSTVYTAGLGVNLNNRWIIEHGGDGTLAVQSYYNYYTHEFTGDGEIANSAATGNLMTNDGVTLKTGGTGVSIIEPEFLNIGEVEVQSGTLLIQNPVDIDGSTLTGGKWTARNGSTLILDAAQALETNEGSLTLARSGSSIIVGPSPIEDTLLANHAHLTVTENRTFANTLHNTLRFWIGSGGTVTVNINNDGWVGVTGSPGLATIDGDVTFGPTGKFDVSLGGITPVTEHDVIEVNGTVQADGTIIVRNLNGFDLNDYPEGTSWDVVRATEITGTFNRAVYIDGPDAFLDVEYAYGVDGRDIVRIVYVRRPCNPADIAEPVGVLDLSDIGAFINAFIAGDPLADIAEPFGILDLSDVNEFVSSFVSGCP